MNKKLLISILSLAALLVIAASFFFVSDGSLSKSSVEKQAPPAPPSVAVAPPPPERQTVDGTKLGLNGLPAEKDLSRYSSNPPKPDYEKDILDLAARTDLANLEKAKAILGKMGSLPPDGKVVAMEQATALIPDENYLELRPQLYSAAQTPEIREAMVNDVLTRGEKIRMHSMVDMLRQPPNETQAEIREILLAYIDEDPGNDWAKWDAAVKQFLKDNGEDE